MLTEPIVQSSTTPPPRRKQRRKDIGQYLVSLRIPVHTVLSRFPVSPSNRPAIFGRHPAELTPRDIPLAISA